MQPTKPEKATNPLFEKRPKNFGENPALKHSACTGKLCWSAAGVRIAWDPHTPSRVQPDCSDWPCSSAQTAIRLHFHCMGRSGQIAFANVR